jgi:uncharacterized phage protein (TIGR02216 family)
MMRLSPRDFWALSLPEWRVLCEARVPQAQAPLNRGGLDELLARYPDKQHD